MEFILAASLDQCGLSKRQIDAMAKEGYLTLTDFSLNRYSDIDMVAKKLRPSPERGGVNWDICMSYVSRPSSTG